MTLPSGAGPALRATLDIISPAGTAEGWAMYAESNEPCHVQVRWGDEIVAEDIADRFRPDLLRAGLRHGHCAFYARMRMLPPGSYAFQLFDGRSGAPIADSCRESYEVPPFDAAPRQTVADILRPRDRWADKDVLETPAGLPLLQNYQSLGARRFVERIFQFALGRWADQAGGDHYADMLDSGQMAPEEVLAAVLNSTERQQQQRPLPRPTDPTFPFYYTMSQ